MTTPEEANVTALQEAPYRSLYELTGDIKDLNTMLVPRTALAQQGEQQPVCHGCGIPADDVHMSTCKSGKWPSRVSNGDTAALGAEIAAIDATEPIARAMSDKTNTGYVYVKVLADKLQFGANLYSHPMPAESKDAERYRWLRDYLISPSTHFDDLIVSADKADTLDGVIDAARAKDSKQ